MVLALTHEHRGQSWCFLDQTVIVCTILLAHPVAQDLQILLMINTLKQEVRCTKSGADCSKSTGQEFLHAGCVHPCTNML